MANAINRGSNYAVFRLRSNQQSGYSEWNDWNWHVEVYAKGGGIGATAAERCYLWKTECPTKRFKNWTIQGVQNYGDPDNEAMNGCVCGCFEDNMCDYYSCQFGGNLNNHYIGVFYVMYQQFQNESTLSSNVCPCASECGSGSGPKKTCSSVSC